MKINNYLLRIGEPFCIYEHVVRRSVQSVREIGNEAGVSSFHVQMAQ